MIRQSKMTTGSCVWHTQSSLGIENLEFTDFEFLRKIKIVGKFYPYAGKHGCSLSFRVYIL